MGEASAPARCNDRGGTEREPPKMGSGQGEVPHNEHRGRSGGPPARQRGGDAAERGRGAARPPDKSPGQGAAPHPNRAAGALPPPLTAFFLATILSRRLAMRTISSSPPIAPLPGVGAGAGRGSGRGELRSVPGAHLSPRCRSQGGRTRGTTGVVVLGTPAPPAACRSAAHGRDFISQRSPSPMPHGAARPPGALWGLRFVPRRGRRAGPGLRDPGFPARGCVATRPEHSCPKMLQRVPEEAAEIMSTSAVETG